MSPLGMNIGTVAIDGGGVDVDTESAAGKAAALALGITETLIKAFPELLPIYQKFALGNIAEAR